MKLLVGQRALVTGGSRGLGRAIVLALSRHGAKVAFTYVRNEEAAERTRKDATELGAEVLSFRADTADNAATEALVRSLESTWGGLDVLVNNAAITQNLPLALLEEEDFDRVIRVNVKGPFLTSRASNT